MKNKKRNNLVIFVLSILVFVPLVSMAASDNSVLSAKKRSEDKGSYRSGNSINVNKIFRGIDGQENLTDEEREAKRAETEIRKKEMDEKIFSMTSEEKDAMKIEMESKRGLMIKNREEIKNAMETGDYETWLELVKDTDCPFLSEVNSENFAEFTEEHKNMDENRLEGEYRGRGLRINMDHESQFLKDVRFKK